MRPAMLWWAPRCSKSDSAGTTTSLGCAVRNSVGTTTPLGCAVRNSVGTTTPLGCAVRNSAGTTTPLGCAVRNSAGTTTPLGCAVRNSVGTTTPLGCAVRNSVGTTTGQAPAGRVVRRSVGAVRCCPPAVSLRLCAGSHGRAPAVASVTRCVVVRLAVPFVPANRPNLLKQSEKLTISGPAGRLGCRAGIPGRKFPMHALRLTQLDALYREIDPHVRMAEHFQMRPLGGESGCTGCAPGIRVLGGMAVRPGA